MRNDLAHLHAVTDSKDREISELNTAIAIKSDENLVLRNKTKDVNNVLLSTIDNIRITDNIIDDLNKRISRRNIEIADKKSNIGSAESEMDRLNANITKARLDQDKLRCRLDDELDRTNRFKRDNSELIAKGASLVANIRDIESKNANRDAQIGVMRAEIDKLKHSLALSDADNHNLDDELIALKKHSDILHKQNDVLNDELSDALASDDLVHKDKIAIVKDENEKHVRLSWNMLATTISRSPIRK